MIARTETQPSPLHTRPGAPPEHPALDALDGGLLEAVALGAARLTPEQGLDLLIRAPLMTLGRYADARCRALHGDTIRSYVIDRNINYTNICNARCTFCAFRRDGDEHDAYTLDHHDILAKIAELRSIRGTQILMQGGMNPALPLDWYLELLRTIKREFPSIHIHAFSPPEFIEFVHFFDPPGDTLRDKIKWVMVRLKEAGLDSLPGGGGEIFAHPVRRKIGLGKCDATAWLTCMSVAHELGMFTSATMMFGHIEGHADRIHHMTMVRQWQDHALTMSEQGNSDAVWGHYKAFISWPFQRENTPLGRLREWGGRGEGDSDGAPGNDTFPGDLVATVRGDGDPRAHPEFGRRLRLSGSTDYLRTQAVSRLMLDNIYSVGSSWVTMGPHIGQMGLLFGANDMGSVMMEENVVSSAGTTHCLNEPVICRLIRDSGFVPAQRDNRYDLMRIHWADAIDATTGRPVVPDLAVTDWSKHRAKKLHIQSSTTEAKPIDLTTSAAAR